MARQVLPIVGAVVGAFFGAPQLGFAIGSIVGNLVDPVINQGPKMGELPVQTSQEGSPRALIYGTSTCTGYILCFGPPLKTTEIQTGEKGAPKTEVEVVYRNYAIAICEGPIGGILRVWENDKLVYDVRPQSIMLEASAAWLENKVLYLGDEEQLPDIFLQLNVSGVGITPAYRGTAYMVFGLEDLTDTQGAIKQYRWEVAGTTQVEEILSPLIVNDWTTPGRPEHEDGETSFTIIGGTEFDDFDVGAEAASAEAVASGTASALESTLYLGYFSSLVAKPSGFDGGATLSGDPETLTYLLGPTAVDRWSDLGKVSPFVCANLGDEGVEPGDGQLVAMWDASWGTDAPVTWTVLSQLYAFGTSPGTGPYSTYWNNCNNYPVEGGGLPGASGTRALPLVAKRVPSPPVGYTKIVGTAKQLCAVEYRDGALYQNALGPVLLPDDPDYDNADFWEDARDAAVLAGIMESDVTYPVEVDAYASGDSTVAGLPVELGIIVADLHGRARIPSADYDVSELTDLVKGLTLTGEYTAADAINTLRSCYFFDKAEPGDKLYYPKRGKAVVETLTFDDLVDVPDLSKREQLSEVPKKLHLHSLDPTAGYAPVKATYERSSVDVKAVAESTISVPVVLNVDERQQMVHKMFKVMSADAQGEIKLSIPDKFIRLIPSDCIGLSLRGQLLRLRYDDGELQEGVMGMTLRRDRQSAYTSNLTGIPIPEPMAPPSTIVGETVFAVMDMSARQDSEDDLHILVAGTGASDGWPGWALQRSLDGGANYTTVATYNSAAIVGILADDVPDADDNVTDTTNVVRVELIRQTESQTLESLTEAQFLSESGAFCLENDDGTWEVMQYLDAVQDSNGIFELSTLHRGRLNSGSSAHSTGAKFVLLQTAEHVVMESAWIGQSIKWRGVSLGGAVEGANTVTATYVGRSQTEWPVASLLLARDGSDIVTGSWAPRFRFGTDDAPVNSANMTGFRITIVGSSTVVLPDQTANSFSYDASALGASVTVSVQALNRITGAGPATSGTV